MHALHDEGLMSCSHSQICPASAPAVFLLLCTTFFLAHLIIPAAAQDIPFESDRYTLKHYTAETGLPQNSIKTIVPDDAGFFWLGTEDGLARFDGRNFHIFNTSNTKLASNRVVQSFRGPSDGLPCLLDEADQVFQVSRGGIVETGRYKEFLRDLHIENDPGKSLFHAFELSNRHIYNYNWKNALVTASATSRYLCDTSEVIYFHNGKQTYETRNAAENVLDYFAVGEDLYFFDRPNGNIFRIDRQGRHEVTITGDFVEHSNGHPADLEILWNTFSKMPLLTAGGRIYSIDLIGRDNFNTGLLIEGFDTAENKIISSFYDKQSGLLLLGSHTRGLFVFTKKHFSAFKDSEGFSFHEQSLYQNRYIITNFGAYDIVSKGKAPSPIARFNGKNPFFTKNGYAWGYKLDTMFLYRQDDARVVGKWHIGDNASIFYADLDGNLWVGYRTGRIRRFDMKTFKWTYLSVAGLDLHITFFQQEKSADPQKRVFWMGSRAGLFRITLPGYHVEKIKNLDNREIHSLFLKELKNETEIWGTIVGKGLFLIKNNRVTLFPADRKKNLASAHCITEDKKGFFWVHTNKGLYQISSGDLRAYAAHSVKNLYYHYYDYKSGFLTNEFNGGCIPCSLVLPDGLFSLPSINGLVYFNPAILRPALPDKLLLIDRIEYNGKRLGYSDTLRLGGNFEFLKLSASTPYFGNSDNVQIDYQLSSSRQTGSWLPVRDVGEIVFNGLSYGHYILTLRKLNGFGRNNYTVRRLVLIIAPKWYETWWFKTLLLFLVLLGTFAFSKWRTDTIKRQNEDLERAVTERTSALKASQNELSRQLNIQAHLIASITHDVRAPLKYVTQASRQITKLNEQGQREMLDQVGHALEQSLVQMTNFLDNLLSYVRTTLYHSKVEMSQIDLSELIREKLVLFEKVFLLYKNDVSNEVHPGLTVHSNPELLSVVIHNLIDNASKYARSGQIRIYSTSIDDKLHLVIADSGKGIDAEIREWFNNPASAHSESYGNASPKGFGLVIVKEVARLIDLSVFVDNHSGCEFHLVFDTPNPGGQLQ